MDLICESEDVAQLKFDVYDPESNRLEKVLLKVKSMENVSLPIPSKTLNKEKYSFIKVNIIKAYNNERRWILLTNLAVSSKEDLELAINCYRMRWHIEDYHKVLKTGFQIEKVYLHSSSKAIKSLLTMIAICACRLYWMIFVGRGHSKQSKLLFCRI